ncbi:transcriptional regulator, LacI family, partial [Streptomyces sp. SolWspMP-sol7th]
MAQTTRRPAPRYGNRPTMKDVAARAGVGLKTVSRVVNDEPGVTPDTERRVREAIAALGFRRNDSARVLRKGRTASVGLILEDLADPFYGPLSRAVEEVARAHGALLINGSSAEDPERERELALALCARRVDGLVVIPAGDDHRYLQPEIAAGMAAVFVDRPAGGIEADVVLSDSFGGAREGVRHLLAHGHRRVGFIGDMPRIHTAAERLRGYRAALAEAGITPDPEWVSLGVTDPQRVRDAAHAMLGGPEPRDGGLRGEQPCDGDGGPGAGGARAAGGARRFRRLRTRRPPRSGGHRCRAGRRAARAHGGAAALRTARRSGARGGALRPADAAHPARFRRAAAGALRKSHPSVKGETQAPPAPRERFEAFPDQSAARGDLVHAERFAVGAAQEVPGERAGGRGLVEHVAARAGGVGGQAVRGALPVGAVEGVDRRVAGRQVGGVHVPALVVGAGEGARDEAVVQSPGGVHLFRGADRQDVGGAVREPHTRSRRRELHDGLRVVGGGVVGRLVRGADAECGAVVEGAVVQRGDAALPGVDHAGDGRGAVRAEDGLRGLDLDLEADAARREPPRLLEGAEEACHGGDLGGVRDLGQRQDEAGGQARRGVEERGEEEVEGADAPFAHGGFHALDPDADPGGDAGGVGIGARGGDEVRGAQRVGVLLGVGPHPV